MHAQVVFATPAKGDLSNLAIGRGLEGQAGSSLMAISSLQKKSPGDVVFSEGDRADSVFEIIQGSVRLYKLLPDGRRLITGFLCAGKLLGLAPEGVCIYTAEAMTQVTLCRYRRAALERLMDEIPGFAKRLFAVASHELRAAQDQMLLLGRKTAVEKVATFLLMMANRRGNEESEELDVPMTRTDIADHLGLTAETVCRTLSKLKQGRLITFESKSHIRIMQRARLKDLASGEKPH